MENSIFTKVNKSIMNSTKCVFIKLIISIILVNYLQIAFAQENQHRQFAERLLQLDNSNIFLKISNYGVIDGLIEFGKPLSPSDQKYLYLSKASLWVGGITSTGDILVSSGDGNEQTKISEWIPVSASTFLPNVSEIEDGVTTDCIYDDLIDFNGHKALGVRIYQKSYSWPSNTFIIFEYIVQNMNTNNNLSNVFIGLKCDFDIPSDIKEYYSDDTVGLLPDEMLSYMTNFDGKSNQEPCGGIKILSHSLSNHSYWSCNDDWLTDEEKYKLLSEGNIESSPESKSDYCVLRSVGPFNLKENESVEVAFVLLQGNNLSELGANAKIAQIIYDVKLSGSLKKQALENESDLISDKSTNVQRSYILEQNYPNPFNALTLIRYELSEPGFVRLKIYTLSGELVKDLVSEDKDVGRYNAIWDGTDSDGIKISTGIYLYQLLLNNSSEVKKMMYLK